MGFLDKLKKLAEGVVAQANPRDNGKTFDTVQRGVAPGTPRPAPQSQPVRTPPPTQRAALPDQKFKGFSLDEGQNKTIFGWNAAALLPKNYEKTYGLKTDRDISTNKDKFVAQFDKINPDFQKKYVTDLQDLASKGDEGAKNSLEALRSTGRFKGNAMDFIEGSNERFLGGTGRELLRTTDWVLPGKNTFGLEKLADSQDATKTGTRQFTERGKQGETAGTVQKGIVDTAALVIPSSGATKAIEGTKWASNLQKGSKIAQYGAKVLPNLAADLAVGTPIQMAQQKGQGNKPDLKSAVVTSVVADTGVPIVGKVIKKGVDAVRGSGAVDDVIKKGAELVDNVKPSSVAANNPAVRQVDDHIRMLNDYRGRLIERGLKETDPAIKRNAQAVTAALQVKNRLVKQISEGGYVNGGEDLIKQGKKGLAKLDKAMAESDQLLKQLDEGAPVAKAAPKVADNVPVSSGSSGNEALQHADAYNNMVFAKSPFATADDVARLNKEMPNLEGSSLKDRVLAPFKDEGGFVRIPGKSKATDALDAAAAGKRSGFSRTAQGSGELSEELRTGVKAANKTYTPVTNAAQEEAANKLVKKGVGKATTDIMERLNGSKLGTIGDQDVADAIAVLKKLDSKGGTKNLQQATDLIDKLSDHLTKQGQSIQAAALLKMRTPQGLLYSAQKTLKRAGVEVTPEIQKNLDTLLKDVKGSATGSLDHELAIKTMQKYVADQIPTDLSDKITGVWKAGLLTGVRTQTGNALSNMTFAGLHDISKPGATATDALMSLFTGKRSTALTFRGRGSGYVEGLKKGAKFLKTGIDEKAALASKFDIGTEGTGFLSGVQKEINFKNPALNKYVNGVFRLMGAADRPNYYSQLRNSLYDLGTVEAKNQGLKGKAVREFVENFVKDPPTASFQQATNEAEKAVLANDTFLSRLASRARSAANDMDNPLARGVSKGAINVIAPFTKVPSAFVSRVFDFTPVGAVKEAAEQIAKKSLDQRALANAISEATTGTALVYLGKQMADSGILSGGYPDDPKEQQRWKAEGIQPNSIKVGDKWYTLNYFGPVGALFGIGKNVHDTEKEGGGVGAQVLTGTAGVAQTALDQSFLQGVSGVLDAVDDPKRYAESFTKNQTSSVIPTLVKDIAEATDPNQRETRDIKGAVQSRIPGFLPGPGRTDLPVKTDVFGEPLTRRAGEGPSGSINTLINPLRPSQASNDPVLKEVDSLKNNSGEDIFPTPIQGKTSFDGVDTQLNDDQKYELQNTLGQRLKKTWADAINSPEYQKLDNNGKVDMLLDLKRDVSAVVKREFAAKNSLGMYSQDYNGKQNKLTADQLRLAQGDLNYAKYAKRSSTAGEGYSSTVIPDNAEQTTKDFFDKYDSMTTEEREKAAIEDPTWEFQKALADYDRKDKAGSFTKAERIRAEKDLAKEKIGADYSKDIRDIYSLSKGDIYTLITTDQNGKAIADQLNAYDQALVAAGIIDKAKFKNGFAVAKKGGGGKKAAVFRPPSGAGKADVVATYKALASLLSKAKVG